MSGPPLASHWLADSMADQLAGRLYGRILLALTQYLSQICPLNAATSFQNASVSVLSVIYALIALTFFLHLVSISRDGSSSKFSF